LMSKNTDNEKTIPEILETVFVDICGHYCKWPEQYKPEEHDGVELFDSDICYNCPLGKLL